MWEERVTGLLNATTNTFFINGIAQELCESGTCNTDQKSFKAYLLRWMAATTTLAPFTKPTIQPLLEKTAAAVVKTCTGGTSGTMCGLRWTTGTNDGSSGVGEQMSALEAVQSNLVSSTPGFASIVKGTGNSTGSANAGSNGAATAQALISKPVTTQDRIGAGFLTALAMIGVVGGSATMMISE
jgi:mannan endo-1,6-alpha-mannosidase